MPDALVSDLVLLALVSALVPAVLASDFLSTPPVLVLTDGPVPAVRVLCVGPVRGLGSLEVLFTSTPAPPREVLLSEL